MADKKINNLDVHLLMQQNVYLHQMLLSVLNILEHQSNTSSGSCGTDVDSKRHSPMLMFKRSSMTTDPLEENEDSNQPEEEARVVGLYFFFFSNFFGMPIFVFLNYIP